MSDENAIVTAERQLLAPMNMESALARYNATLDFTKRIMKSGKDYGIIPGTDKPTLLKPGAEKLCAFFGLSVDYVEVEKVVDWEKGLFFYSYKAVLGRHGNLVATGIGSCNSYEKKYRWRWVSESDLPSGADTSKMMSRSGTLREPTFAISRSETGGKYGKPAAYWQRFKDAMESGAGRHIRIPKRGGGEDMDGWEIGGTLYRVQNDDLADSINTVQKMAQKRALIAATLIAANASEFYTQDLDDLDFIEGETIQTPQDAQHANGESKPQPVKPAATSPAPNKPGPDETFNIQVNEAMDAREFTREDKAKVNRLVCTKHRLSAITDLSPDGRKRLLASITEGKWDEFKAVNGKQPVGAK